MMTDSTLQMILRVDEDLRTNSPLPISRPGLKMHDCERMVLLPFKIQRLSKEFVSIRTRPKRKERPIDLKTQETEKWLGLEVFEILADFLGVQKQISSTHSIPQAKLNSVRVMDMTKNRSTLTAHEKFNEDAVYLMGMLLFIRCSSKHFRRDFPLCQDVWHKYHSDSNFLW